MIPDIKFYLGVQSNRFENWTITSKNMSSVCNKVWYLYI